MLKAFSGTTHKVADDPQARCGEVLTGAVNRTNVRCLAPLYATNGFWHMVSSEGACAAYYQYRREA